MGDLIFDRVIHAVQTQEYHWQVNFDPSEARKMNYSWSLKSSIGDRIENP